MNSPIAQSNPAASFPVRQLLEASAYPHETEQLRLLETHISWVVLTGPFAYKIKKAVHYDFLDASTLQLRRHYCEEELRLNARLAPELYLAVVPIFLVRGQLRVGGTTDADSSEPIEYAVQMRQFSNDAVLTQLLQEQDVSIEEITNLGGLLARFHLAAPVSQWDGSAYRTNQMYDVVLSNSAQLLEHTPAAESYGLRQLVDELRDNAVELEPLLQARERDGWIRECHGDLHAGNIVRWRKDLIPFDCIDFNPALRWIDTMSDTAFLVMDLVSQERSDLAAVLLDHYLEVTADYAGVRLLPFYSAYRALVRAKVDALAMKQQPEASQSLRQRFDRRVHTAVQWIKRPQPTLALMHGPSGSGKSWLSAQLVASLPALRVRSDVERQRLRQSDADQPYSAEMTHRTYARLADCAESCLQAGFNVVVDATFQNPIDRALFRGLANRLRARFVTVSCQADPQTLHSRVRARAALGRDVSEADNDVLEAQLRQWQPLSATEVAETVIAQTTQADVVERVTAAVQLRS